MAIGGTVLADIQRWSGYVGSVLEALAGKVTAPANPATPAKTTAIGLTIGVDPLPEVTAGLTAAGKIADVVLAYENDVNTPEMINASEAKKLQAFKDRVAKDLQTGDESDLENLEAQ